MNLRALAEGIRILCLRYGTFKGWVAKRMAPQEISRADSAKPGFIALTVDEAVRPVGAARPFMELTLANGNQLTFYQSPAPEYLRELLK
jgi:hypothetical protein